MLGLQPTVATTMKVGAAFALASALYLQPYRVMVVMGDSMEPSYSSHSLLLVEPVSPDQLAAGMVVIVNRKSGPIIKRIAYMPGDVIQQARVSGQWFDMTYMRPATGKQLTGITSRRFVVPPNTVYILGDNQRVSYDSKHFGCVPVSEIREKVCDQRPFDILCTKGCPAQWSD